MLVTGRTRLASLIDRHGAGHLTLDVLTGAEARALLAARLGADRVTAEPAAADELVEVSGGYPLVLSITARHAATTARDLPTRMRQAAVVRVMDSTGTPPKPPTASWIPTAPSSDPNHPHPACTRSRCPP